MDADQPFTKVSDVFCSPDPELAARRLDVMMGKVFGPEDPPMQDYAAMRAVVTYGWRWYQRRGWWLRLWCVVALLEALYIAGFWKILG